MSQILQTARIGAYFSPQEGEFEESLLQLIFISLCCCSIFQQLLFG